MTLRDNLNLNLILSFKLTGDSDLRICGATRIKVDGYGGLTLYDAGSGLPQRIDLANLQSFSIQSPACAGKAA